MADVVRLDAESMRFMVTRYRGRSLLFAEEILQRKWDTWQVKAFNALDNGSGPQVRRMSRLAGHGVGKSWFAGAVALHRLCTLAESQSILTSATYAQLTTRLWPTVAKLIHGSRIPNWFTITSDTVKIRGLETNWIKAQPWNRSNSESFAGLHVKSPALIADEASAIEDVIFEAFEGSMQHDNSFMLMLGNPLYRKGALFDSANSKRNLYDCDSISCIGSAYTSQDWIKEMGDTFGEDSDVFRTRVLGQFPQSESEGFIPEATIRLAVGRKVSPVPSEARIGGLDVARFGANASVLTIRQGPEILLRKKWHQMDTMDMAEECAQLLRLHDVDVCCVDANGVGGPVADRLRKLYPDKIIDVMLNAGGGDSQYHDKRTKIWGLSREWLAYGSLPDDKDLIASGSSLMYTFDNKGRIALETKDMASKRGVMSPDDWDSLSFTFACTITKGRGVGTYTDRPTNRSQVSIAW